MFSNIKLSALQLDKIRAAAFADYPNEMCGLLTVDDFIHCENTHPNPISSFTIDPLVFAKHYSETVAVVHTHTKDPEKRTTFDLRTPSVSDMRSQENSGLPWLIFGCEGRNVSDPVQLPRTPSRNYIGRPFLWFINDCYTLVQDFYRFELGILLPNSCPPEGFKTLLSMNNIFDKHIDNYGFRSKDVRDIENGDLILCDNAGFKRNHLGVFQDGKIIHQSLVSVSTPFEHFIGRIREVLYYDPTYAKVFAEVKNENREA